MTEPTLTPEQVADPNRAEWVHDVNVNDWRSPRSVGSVFGWHDGRSETGMLSGIIVEVDHRHLRVKVRDIRAGVIAR